MADVFASGYRTAELSTEDGVATLNRTVFKPGEKVPSGFDKDTLKDLKSRNLVVAEGEFDGGSTGVKAAPLEQEDTTPANVKGEAAKASEKGKA